MSNTHTDHFSSIPQAITELTKGNMLIVVDDPTRENQGDIIFPAESITTEKANFIMKECRGMFCVPMTRERAATLGIGTMIPLLRNTESLQCNFGITVDAKGVTSHGISASDRALTVKKICDDNATSQDFMKPGHVSPIIAMDGGVVERDGHTEAAIDLARLAGFKPLGVLSEIMRDDGEPALLPDLVAFGKKHNLKIITIADLKAYLSKHPLPALPYFSSLLKQSESRLPTTFGTFQIAVYQSSFDKKKHIALTMGDVSKQPVLTRIHSKCFTGDTLLSLRCDCRNQLHASMEMIQKEGNGIILYLNQEGREIGLINKIKAYALQDQDRDTIEANHELGFPTDARDYGVAATILKDLGITAVQLLTNNPDKIAQLQQNGITIERRIPVITEVNTHNKKYLTTKKARMKHLL